MKKKYPVSLPVHFAGFPPMFKVTCGASIPSPYSYGSRVILHRTPLCGIVQGGYEEGKSLPDLSMIYSDTGQDGNFDLKLSFYGWGTFYKDNDDAPYCSLEIRKGIKVEAHGISKKFETHDIWETLIPASTVLTDNPIIKNIALLYTEKSSTPEPADGYVRVLNKSDIFSPSLSGGIRLNGTLQLSGEGIVWLKS